MAFGVGQLFRSGHGWERMDSVALISVTPCRQLRVICLGSSAYVSDTSR